MIWDRLQRRVVTVPSVSLQRCLLIAVSVIAAAAASTSAALAAGQQSPFVLALVVGLAVGSALAPDSHVATLTETVVVVQWVATTEDTTSGWAMLVALCLFVFHVTIALMTMAPIAATIDRSIVLRWSRRSVWIVAATIAMWALVWAMSERRADGSAALTFVGFLALTGLILVTRSRSASPDDRRA